MTENKTIWIVLGVIGVAILLFLVLGQRPDEEVVEGVNETATTTMQVMDRSAARTEAAADLTALRLRQEAGESYESLSTEYAEVRRTLAASYTNAELEAQQEWAELSAEFDEFEASARAGTSTALDLLARLIASLSSDVRTETPTE